MCNTAGLLSSSILTQQDHSDDVLAGSGSSMSLQQQFKQQQTGTGLQKRVTEPGLATLSSAKTLLQARLLMFSKPHKLSGGRHAADFETQCESLERTSKQHQHQHPESYHAATPPPAAGCFLDEGFWSTCDFSSFNTTDPAASDCDARSGLAVGAVAGPTGILDSWDEYLESDNGQATAVEERGGVEPLRESLMARAGSSSYHHAQPAAQQQIQAELVMRTESSGVCSYDSGPAGMMIMTCESLPERAASLYASQSSQLQLSHMVHGDSVAADAALMMSTSHSTASLPQHAAASAEQPAPARAAADTLEHAAAQLAIAIAGGSSMRMRHPAQSPRAAPTPSSPLLAPGTGLVSRPAAVAVGAPAPTSRRTGALKLIAGTYRFGPCESRESGRTATRTGPPAGLANNSASLAQPAATGRDNDTVTDAAGAGAAAAAAADVDQQSTDDATPPRMQQQQAAANKAELGATAPPAAAAESEGAEAEAEATSLLASHASLAAAATDIVVVKRETVEQVEGGAAADDDDVVMHQECECDEAPLALQLQLQAFMTDPEVFAGAASAAATIYEDSHLLQVQQERRGEAAVEEQPAEVVVAGLHVCASPSPSPAPAPAPTVLVPLDLSVRCKPPAGGSATTPAGKQSGRWSRRSSSSGADSGIAASSPLSGKARHASMSSAGRGLAWSPGPAALPSPPADARAVTLMMMHAHMATPSSRAAPSSSTAAGAAAIGGNPASAGAGAYGLPPLPRHHHTPTVTPVKQQQQQQQSHYGLYNNHHHQQQQEQHMAMPVPPSSTPMQAHGMHMHMPLETPPAAPANGLLRGMQAMQQDQQRKRDWEAAFAFGYEPHYGGDTTSADGVLSLADAYQAATSGHGPQEQQQQQQQAADDDASMAMAMMMHPMMMTTSHSAPAPLGDLGLAAAADCGIHHGQQQQHLLRTLSLEVMQLPMEYLLPSASAATAAHGRRSRHLTQQQLLQQALRDITMPAFESDVMAMAAEDDVAEAMQHQALDSATPAPDAPTSAAAAPDREQEMPVQASTPRLNTTASVTPRARQAQAQQQQQGQQGQETPLISFPRLSIPPAQRSTKQAKRSRGQSPASPAADASPDAAVAVAAACSTPTNDAPAKRTASAGTKQQQQQQQASRQGQGQCAWGSNGQRVASLADLMREGLLPVGTAQLSAGSLKPVTVELRPEGVIVYEGESFTSPSHLALKLLQTRNAARTACDGWRELRFRGRKLQELRKIASARMYGGGASGK